jgi:serine/threonine protein kinase
VASGLSAVHKQNLVHRDIKPSNIMVSLEGDGATAKIIDLGLAKAVVESQSETAVSIPGSFAGTPEFASPEQFAGVGVDIRSDLYSLGVTLWNMVSGQPPFRGTSAELMQQHLHPALPIGQLNRVPQPASALIQALLEKDPTRRFQNPVELLKAMPMITAAIDARRRITRQSFQKNPPADSRIGTRKSPRRLGPKKISVARLPVTGSAVFGGVVALPLQTNFWTRLSLGLAIQIHDLERRGKRAKDWRSSSHIVGLCWFWTAWSRSKTRLVHTKDAYVSLPSRLFCARLLPSIGGFARLPPGCNRRHGFYAELVRRIGMPFPHHEHNEEANYVRYQDIPTVTQPSPDGFCFGIHIG